MEQKTFMVLPYHELDALIARELNVEHLDDGVVASDEMNNDNVYEFSRIDGALDKYDMNKIAEALKAQKVGQWNTRNWLNWLVKFGKLPPGDYLVDVCW